LYAGQSHPAEPDPEYADYSAVLDSLFRQVAVDGGLFAAVVGSIHSVPQQPLHVDPRPLRYGPGIYTPEVELLADVDSASVRMRVEVLERLGIPLGDAVRDIRCLLSGRETPERIEEVRKRCGSLETRKTAILSLPHPARAGSYGAGETKLGQSNDGLVTIRVVEILVGPRMGAFETLDYLAAPRPDGTGWEVRGKRLVFAQ
jgi:hypothetical protein